MGIRIENGDVWIGENQGGSYGSSYMYVNENGILKHISRFFKGKLIHVSRSGRKKTYEYRIPLGTLKDMFGDKVEIYEFSFTTSGFLICRAYEVDCVMSSIREFQPQRIPGFEIMNAEKYWLDLYDRTVPKMIERIKDIQQALGIELFFAKKSVRLEDIYRNPTNGKKTALTFPQPQARSRALQGYIQAVHELYVLMLVAKALGGKTIHHVYNGKPAWWIAHAQDYPTAVVETNNRKFTVWYQFSAKDWIDVVFTGLVRENLSPGELEKLAMEGKFDVLERIFGQRPKDVREAYSMIANFKKLTKRQYVKPDIVIFEGDYRWKDELKEIPPSNVLVIDSKIEISDTDIEQLKSYRELFNSKFSGGRIHYIIACLGKTNHKDTLEKLGYYVIEDVFPDEKGEDEFVKVVKDLLSI